MLAVESTNSPNVRERFLSDCSCSLQFVGRKLPTEAETESHRPLESFHLRWL